MGVQFILGNSGNGKSYYIYNKIVQESYGDIGGNYLVIVPEQFTMQTQKTLVSLHRNHSIQNIDILSFERLSYRIFDELGVKSNHVLEESGKNFLLKRVADREKGKLSVLGSNISKMGYISEMKSLISEFMQYGVKPEDIANINSMHSKSFEMKLKDVEILYRGFLDELEGTYITSEEILSLLISVAHKSKILKNATLVFDGYTGFTPVQKELLAVLMPIVKDIYVTATMDVNDRSFYDAELHEPYVTDVKAVREHDLFAMSKKMFIELFQMAKSTKVEWMDPYICTGENGRLSSSKELSFLEKHIFRRDRSVYGDAPTNIIISSLKDEKDEIKYAAETIAELVRKQGYRFKDIAVVLGNVDAYSDYIKYIFEKYDIPVFMDEKKALLKHPFIEFVRALLDMTDKSYTYDSVFRYLRSGFSGVEDSDVDILENYVRAVGIRGKKRWSEEFTYTPGDLNVDIDHLNEIRQRFCDTVLPVNEGMKKKGVTVGERCEVLRTFFENIGIRETLESRKAYFEEQNDLKKADEYGQIYDVVDGLLEKLNNLLGDFTMSFSEFVELFDAGLEAVKIGIIPPGYDRVVVGDIERTRLNDVKALFLVGANDGNIPKSGSGGGIISESERELLKENDIELAPSEREDAFMQKFYLYMILTKSSEKLFVTFSRSGVDGTAKRRSYLIGTLLKLFNKLEILMPDMDKGQITYLRGDSLLDDIALLISEKEDIDKNKLEAVLHWIKNNKPLDAGRVMKIIKASTEEYKTMPLSKDVVTKIYGKTIVGSVTRLEKFAACEYAHFLYYGLKLRERAELSFGGIDIGNIIHGALERYAVLLKDAGLRWRDANEADSERILGEALRYSLEANHNLALLEDARSKYTFNRIERYMKRTVKVIKNQIKAGKFEPTEFEKRFEVNNIEGAKLIGTIDRIDTAEIDGEVYVNIIDYKTGKNELSFPDIYSGEQLQLSVYMSMALKMYKEKYPNKNVRPGGMFYYHVDDTIVNGNFDIDDLTLEKSLFTSYKLNGAIVDNPNVYTGMDFSLRESSQKSDIINVSTKKDGETGSTSSLYNEEVFEDILIYADEKSAELCESIFNGDIEVNPSKKPGTNGMSACTYCPMNSVCGFDEKIKGYSYKKSSVNGKDEALAAIIASIEE